MNDTTLKPGVATVHEDGEDASSKPREALMTCSANGHGGGARDPDPRQTLVIGGGQFKKIGITSLEPYEVFDFEVEVEPGRWKHVRGKVMKNGSVNCSGVGDPNLRLLHEERRTVLVRRID